MRIVNGPCGPSLNRALRPLQVWLASERTFLNWLRVAFLLSSFALALFNSARPQDRVARAMGVIYAIIAVSIIGYAYVMQRVRRHRIIHRYAGHHGEGTEAIQEDFLALSC